MEKENYTSHVFHAPLVLHLIINLLGRSIGAVFVVAIIDFAASSIVHAKWLRFNYNYLFEAQGPFEVVRRFDPLHEHGPRLESYTFFEFFLRRYPDITVQDLLSHKYYIVLEFDVSSDSYVYDVVHHVWITRTAPTVRTISSTQDMLKVGVYNVYGPYHIIDTQTTTGHKHLLFRGGPHFQSFNPEV